ncbi:UDP-N-acetylmuramoyl-L-alanine--D-glutamate ligase [Parapedobacter sp. ISTM3]|uniref:UDP-N-acetylmuramoylalanine--D-glutamate ligase n=1 Tax=Parapedobacter luteus TaxID=623280 RepID=A0A1T5E1I9_9SPHI|nr:MULTISPECIES: UDP-N-acetylmuramoyl-L-alanine--D-glutamate ligase [Parapedobacter]MBK1441002.1 UDP-N-acetylmuramoyl-L-alanine--D-glutamate ligase [Parapedobacter sp. ISTM3]SKB77610.1 UDP-N-acetylmuramoylalanine--D-glutamate ligase [Parapedobacter luteus]
MAIIPAYHYPQQGKLVVLGAGESGVGTAVLAQKKGFDVWVSDVGRIADQYKKQLEEAQLAYEEGQHSEAQILAADLVIKSPGIPNTAPIVQQLKDRGIPVIAEIEFAAQYTDAKLICITGSNGKSTTTMLTWHILRQGGLNVGLAGNIGRSFALQVANEQYDYYVLELSSFMLDDMEHFRADIAVLLNITPDHLDRYDHKLENYVDSKFRIIRNQRPEDHFIYCLDDPITKAGLERHQPAAMTLPFSLTEKVVPGAYLDEKNELVINVPQQELFTMDINELSLQGKHNIYNNMASGLVAKVQELRNASMKESMGSFKNIPHRLEFVACIAGVNYINDSKATNVNAVWYALESLAPQIVLIMGGVDKGNDYEMLRDLVRTKVRAIVCIGKDNSRIYDSLEDDARIIVNSSSMRDAVEIASHLAQKGDTVLLSPACASFDWFKNFEDRGNQFKEAVMDL